MTEAELVAEVMAHSGRLGLLVHHCADSRRCRGNSGLPDLIILGPGGILFAEIKGPDGETSADQDQWLYFLHKIYTRSPLHCVNRCGNPRLYHVWKPEDWYNGYIQSCLGELASE